MIQIDIIEFIKDTFDIERNGIIVERNNEMLAKGSCVYGNTLQFNEDLIKEAAEEKNIDLKTYVVIIFLHEYGHLSDPQLSDIDKQINSYQNLINNNGYRQEWVDKFNYYSHLAEENAWHRAEQFINPDLLETLTLIKDESLSLHREVLELQSKIWKSDHKRIFQ